LTKIDAVPPTLSYCLIAAFKDVMVGMMTLFSGLFSLLCLIGCSDDYLPCQAFHVDWHLNCNVRIFNPPVTSWIRSNCAMISGIASYIANWAE